MKAPPCHTFIDSNENDELDNYWDAGRKSEQANSSNSKNVSDILKWISDVTIKRRKFRKRFRCSHLLAEAVLSNTLRSARQDLTSKQEEKRKKAHEFSYQLSIQFSQVHNTSSYSEKFNDDNDNHVSSKSRHNSNNTSLQMKANDCSIQSDSNNNGHNDEHVQDCISSLDNFFSELKSIKVSVA